MAPPDGDSASAPTPTESQSQPRGGDSARGRGRGRGKSNQNRRGGARRGRGGNTDSAAVPASPAAQDVAAAASRAHALGSGATAKPADGDEDDEDEVCFICANPVAHHSIAPCNHTTCHICGLRMRALYKTKDCAHCRAPADFVIFTDDAEKRFEDYKSTDITTADSNIGIKYTNEDIVGDTVLLLRYNCPDPSCDFAGLGWPDLHRHVKSAHRKRMCDLCTRNKKVFTHEHELFADRELEKHMRYGDDKPGAADQTGFKGHPLCGFCGERFYDDDKLYEHCRTKHERCFICDRRDSRKPHYYQDYDALEQHFKKDHFLCADRECLEKKFVVFDTELDFQAHQLSEHGGRSAGRDARVVDISGFDFRQTYQQERRGGGGGGGGGRDGEGRGGREGRNRGRGRDPNAETVPVSSAQPLRRDELAFQRQMAIHSAQSVSNRTFGGQLSGAPAPSPQPRSGGNATPQSSQNNLSSPMESLTVSDTANVSPEERARLVRHGAVVERASNLLGNDTQRMATFRAHISSYRQGGFTAPQLIDAFFTLFADTSSNALGTLVREVAELYDDKKKADALRKAWQDWRAINEDYPSLPGLSGMHGATSSSSGWADASAANPAVPTAAPSAKHSNRVLKLKNSTRLGGPAPVTGKKLSTWGAGPALQAPSSSAAFPSLSAAGSSSAAGPSSRPSSQPSWNAGSSSQAAPPPPLNRPRNTRGGEDAFPALPTAPKPQTTIFGYGNGRLVRRDYGHRESNFQWGGSGSSTPAVEEPAQEADDGASKGKKGGKNKKKQVLVQWG
ncbi:E3 ubiquitin-protein ligase hel2 [Neonectria ditissima]|uniref:RING-type E3 ubiquitin transferase n=1 Tax=Neonectria ditissima TaxID=78410 RepID=A0A0P7BH23_9HYPO|nr:E3 ubiquitin-protein ligase hel2 [Neonectria ditissima]